MVHVVLHYLLQGGPNDFALPFVKIVSNFLEGSGPS